MPNYRFKFYDPNGGSEKLGAAVFVEDDEAIGFVHRVIRELIHSDEKLYTTWKVDITTRERKLASVSFAAEATPE